MTVIRAVGTAPTFVLVLLLVLASCTTARRPPWIIEQPLYKAAPEPTLPEREKR